MANQADPFAAVVRTLARRDLTAAEIDQHLARADFPDDERADATARARDAGYIDDERVARERARRLVERGWSNAGIRLELERRGVESATVESTIEELGDEHERAAKLVRKIGTGPRAARSLVRRGFTLELVQQVLGSEIADLP